MDGIGGGHPHASGARIPTAKIMEFIKALNTHSEE
jgi:nanoRNase/pAp phosphatase (c-di-AMP/oligoRNAs hydrolase)